MAKREKVRKRRRHAIYTPILVLIMILIAMFGIGTFFRVSKIVVTGTSRYSPDDVIAASGIETGSNLILTDQSSTAARIRSLMPYISEVKVVRRLPDTVLIEITESTPVAWVQASDSRYIIDRGGRLLEKSDDNGTSTLIAVTGITPLSPAIGQKINVDSSQSASFSNLTKALSALADAGIQSNVTTLDVSNIGDISFDYMGRFKVEVGNGDNMVYKFQKLQEVVTQLKSNSTGKIDLSSDGETRFIPDQS